MSDEIYYKLAEVLDTLPNGFPRTENGVEIKILKRIFTPEEAELFCDLRLSFETPQQIAERTGRDLGGLEEMLDTMRSKGQIFRVKLGDTKVYKMLPWVWGIFEFQVGRLDKEMVGLFHEYEDAFGPQFFGNHPQYARVIPVEKDVSPEHQALSYEKVSHFIENSKDFAVNDCICKKEQELLGHRCGKPMEVCLGFAPVPDVFTDGFWGRQITREEAYEVLRKSEEAGLVHVVANVQNGNIYICNCCECCCGLLKGINKFGIIDSLNSSYYAIIDEDECASCGICKDERCQVAAIEESDAAYRVITERCIGCGLCISTCPSDAISLVRKDEKDVQEPAFDERDWNDARGKHRGVGFEKYK